MHHQQPIPNIYKGQYALVVIQAVVRSYLTRRKYQYREDDGSQTVLSMQKQKQSKESLTSMPPHITLPSNKCSSSNMQNQSPYDNSLSNYVDNMVLPNGAVYKGKYLTRADKM